MKRIRTLVVDDEPLARRGMVMLLETESQFEITECASGPEAVAEICEDPPDLVLLDIQMPEMDGFGVIDAIGADRMPVVIFVTAYDEYALKAFDAHALDYVLKPIDENRFREALDRARARILSTDLSDVSKEMRSMLDEMRSEREARRDTHPHRLVVREAGRVFFLPVGEIDWMEAAGNYVKLHRGGRTHLIRDSMTHLEERLDPESFIRISRSAIVNIDCIRELRPISDSRFRFILRDGTDLESSRRYRPNMDRLLSPRDR
jgi:two-component system LytT family response regulator